MKEEYNYTLTVPLEELEEGLKLIEEIQRDNPHMRMSRKPDTKKAARFYLCFPYSGSRTDLRFKEWIAENNSRNWDLYGPNYGVWGLA